VAAPHLNGERIAAAGFGIAGPVINNTVRATNLRGLSKPRISTRMHAPGKNQLQLTADSGGA